MVCLYRLIYNEWLIFTLFRGFAFLFFIFFFARSFCFLSSINFLRDIESIRGYWWKILNGWLLKKTRKLKTLEYFKKFKNFKNFNCTIFWYIICKFYFIGSNLWKYSNAFLKRNSANLKVLIWIKVCVCKE